MIRKLPMQKKYRIYSLKTGRNLGTYKTRIAAENREKQINFFKRFKKK